MIMRMGDVLTAVRGRLGDINKTGWTDERLMTLVNQGQFDICKTTNIYRLTTYLPLANDIVFYSLPRNCFNITRLEYDGKVLPIYSREDIDNTLELPTYYAIKSNLNRQVIEIRPTLTDLRNFNSYIKGMEIALDFVEGVGSLGVVSAVYNEDTSTWWCINSAVGCTTLIAYHEGDMTDEEIAVKHTAYGDLSGFLYAGESGLPMSDEGVFTGGATQVPGSIPNLSVYGFLSAIGNLQVRGIYGVTTGFVLEGAYAKVFYTATPPIVNWLSGALILDPMWFQALVHYTVGMARQDDNDEGNYQLGEFELVKYSKEVEKAQKQSSRNFSSQNSKSRQTIYRRF